MQYGTAVAFDLLYVGVFRLGARGIPLGLLTSLTVTCGVAFCRNVASVKQVFDRALGVYTFKNLLGAALAALAVWGLRFWFELPQTGLKNFLYLSELCGAGTLVFIAALAASKAVPVSQVAAIWQSAEDS